jgi:hypothetical protein
LHFAYTPPPAFQGLTNSKQFTLPVAPGETLDYGHAHPIPSGPGSYRKPDFPGTARDHFRIDRDSPGTGDFGIVRIFRQETRRIQAARQLWGTSCSASHGMVGQSIGVGTGPEIEFVRKLRMLVPG